MDQTIKTHVKLGEIEGNTWFVGDIHGSYDLLMNSLLKVGFDFKYDRLIAVGDLIDHGNLIDHDTRCNLTDLDDQSEACLMLLKTPWFHSVIGNHEILALDAACSRVNSAIGITAEELLHRRNGGDWFYEMEYENPENRQDELCELITQKMPASIEVSACGAKIGVVHAATTGKWTDLSEAKDRTDMLKLDHYTWTRYGKRMPSTVNGIDAVVMGHQNNKGIVQKSNQVWIDTIKKSGELTIVPASYVLKLCGHYIH